MTKLKDVRNDYHGVTTLTSDIDNTETNIALLAFKVATGDSLTKFDMVDQVIDEYIDNSGIDTINSTNESLASGYYSGTTTSSGNATGGIVTTYGSTVVHTFATGTTNFVTPGNGVIDYLLVAGGGAGGGQDVGGGGGGGGMVEVTAASLTTGTHAVVVGPGGVASNSGSNSNFDGGPSSIGSFPAATGGGGGGGGNHCGSQTGRSGGSGGGGGWSGGGGAGNAGSFSPVEGYSGHAAHPVGGSAWGGGGGGSGASASANPGGSGRQNAYQTGSNIYYGGGGGGGTDGGPVSGGSGGGGTGGYRNGNPPRSSMHGTDGLGGGGGGSGGYGGGTGGDGGDGVVVIKYADDAFLQSSAEDLTLVSTATTAQTEPVTGDVVMLLEDSSGTATLNTDIKAHVSRDDGTTWAETTLTNEGTWGTNKKILVARDVDISGQPSGTSMRYKIETFGQAGSDPHTITANGNAHTDTSVKKIGTASAQFDGTGDYLSIPASTDFDFGSDDFTIEFWFYPNDVSSQQRVFGNLNSGGSSSQFEFIQGGDGVMRFGGTSPSGLAVTSTGAMSNSTWYHFALTRSGSSWILYKDGTAGGTATYSGSMLANTTISIGRSGAFATQYVNGYVDEVRISDTVRYTSNFTPSTSAFLSDENTLLLMHMDGADGGTTFTDEDYVKETRIHATSLAWK